MAIEADRDKRAETLREIRVRDQAGGRSGLVYVAHLTFEEAVYVLHCFGKKSGRSRLGYLEGRPGHRRPDTVAGAQIRSAAS